MPQFDTDVVVIDHDLILQTKAGDEIARIDQDGNIVARRNVGGAIVDVFSFDAASGEALPLLERALTHLDRRFMHDGYVRLADRVLAVPDLLPELERVDLMPQ